MLQYLLLYLSIFFFLDCGLNGQVLASYSDNKVKRKQMREIIKWYNLEDSMKDVKSQKILIKQIVITEILSKKAKELDFDKSETIRAYEQIIKQKTLARILLSRWKENEEKKPETLYQTESIVLTNGQNNKSQLLIKGEEQKQQALMRKIREKIINKKLNFGDVPNYANKYNKIIKYFNLEYLPANAMEKSYYTIVKKLITTKEYISQPISTPYGWQLIRLNDTVTVTKNKFDEYFDHENLNKMSHTGRLYWNRTLNFRNINWKKYLFEKYDIKLEKLPKLPDHWRTQATLFKNKKLKIQTVDFDLFCKLNLGGISSTHDQFWSNKREKEADKLLKTFFELIIFSNEAMNQKLNQNNEFKRLKDWEEKNLLVREYLQKIWLVQRNSKDEKRNSKREEKEKMILKEYNFKIMDANFRNNLI